MYFWIFLPIGIQSGKEDRRWKASIHAYDTRSSSKYNMTVHQKVCAVRQAIPIFIKIMEWDTPERYNVWKRNVSAKINQCALWNIKRQFLWLPWWNHDNARNKIAKSLTLASFTVALNKFVFLAFERQKGGLFLGACFPRKSWNFKALKCICQLLVLIERLLQ